MVISAAAAGARDLGEISNSLTIDDMSLISNWSTQKGDSNDSITLTSTATPASATGIKLAYTLGATSGWVQINKTMQYWKLYGTENLTFLYNKTGSTEKLYVKFKDDDKDIMKILVGTIGDSNGWQTASVNLANFTLGPESEGAGTFAWDKVQSIEFAFDPQDGGSGTLMIDDIYIGIQNLVMDDFEDTTLYSGKYKNVIGGEIGTYNDIGATMYVTNVSTVYYRGAHSMEMKYDNNGTWCGVYMNANGKNVASMNQLRFWVRGAIGGEKMVVQLKTQFGDSSGQGVSIFQDNVAVSTFSGITGITGLWQQVVIDLSKYSANQLGAIQCINFNFSQDIIPIPAGQAAVYIDDLQFYNTNSGQSYYLVDNMDTPVGNTSWATYSNSTSASTIKSVDGYNRGAIEMDYTFGAAQYPWVSMTRSAAMNMSYYDAIYLPIKITGDSNYIEIKLKDSSNIEYYLKKRYTADGTWGTIKAPLKDFTQFGGSGSKLNLKAIYNVSVAVSKYSSAGSGTLYMGPMYVGTEASFFNDFNADDVITSIDVVNNPFRVDGSGFKAYATFVLGLSEPATIRFRVYNLKGIIIYEKEADYAAGTASFNWDGKNNEGTTQRSGLYIYQVQATGATTSRVQKFNNIIGIEK